MTQPKLPVFTLFFSPTDDRTQIEATITRDVYAGICGPWASATIPAPTGTTTPNALVRDLLAASGHAHELTYDMDQIKAEDGWVGQVVLEHV